MIIIDRISLNWQVKGIDELTHEWQNFVIHRKSDSTSYSYVNAVNWGEPDGNELFVVSLQWRHNDHDGVSNHQPHGCLLNCLFRRRSKKTSKLRVTGLCVGNSPGTVNSPHKGPVTRKMFPFDDVIMFSQWQCNVIETLYCDVTWAQMRGSGTVTSFGPALVNWHKVDHPWILIFRHPIFTL